MQLFIWSGVPFQDNITPNSVYAFWSKLLFFELFPYVAIMVCNGFIIAKVYKASMFRSQFNRGKVNRMSTR